MTQCIAFGLLEGYSRGEAPPEQRSFVEAHCSGCDTCRRTLEAVSLGRPPDSPEAFEAEARLVGAVGALRPVDDVVAGLLGKSPVGILRPMEVAPAEGLRSVAEDAAGGRVAEPTAGRVADVSRRGPRWRTRSTRWMAGASSLAAAVAAVALLLPGRTLAPPEMNLPYRAAVGRPALATLPYAPFVPLRGEDRDPPEYDRALGWMLSRPVERRAEVAPYLAALYLWRGERGDRGRAEEALRATPESARRDNDIGVLLLASGEAEAALMAFGAALEKDAGLVEARFNRGLALETLGRRDAAIEAWEEYLRSARDDEWAKEARAHLETLQSADAD